MKTRIAIFAVFSLFLLSACGSPIVVPADLAVTLPPNQAFILRATLTASPVITASTTPLPEDTATPLIPTATLTPSTIPTRKPSPTRRPPYPIFQGEPLIDIGFQPINLENVQQLKPVFSALSGTRRHFVVSGDGQKLFLSTSNGTFLYNRQGESLGYWQNIFTADIPCESCMSANRDGSRLAVITRSAGAWEAQVYDVKANRATLFLALPLEPVFKGKPDEVSIALSPDNAFLAFKAGSGSLRVIDLQTKLLVLDYGRQVNGISFTPDGANFVIHAGQELLFFKVTDWKFPAVNLLLPREDSPYSFSPDGHLLAIALPTLLRMELHSTSFAHGVPIPVRHTCDGANTSPPLAWSGVPDGARSLALIVDDPDAPDPARPKRIWVHWVLYNIPPDVRALPEGGTHSPIPALAREGLNDGDTLGYDGPCPPIGRHRYFHTLYALDAVLPDFGAKARRKDLDAAMNGHVLATAQVMGTYQR